MVFAADFALAVGIVRPCQASREFFKRGHTKGCCSRYASDRSSPLSYARGPEIDSRHPRARSHVLESRSRRHRASKIEGEIGIFFSERRGHNVAGSL